MHAAQTQPRLFTKSCCSLPNASVDLHLHTYKYSTLHEPPLTTSAGSSKSWKPGSQTWWTSFKISRTWTLLMQLWKSHFKGKCHESPLVFEEWFSHRVEHSAGEEMFQGSRWLLHHILSWSTCTLCSSRWQHVRHRRLCVPDQCTFCVSHRTWAKNGSADKLRLNCDIYALTLSDFFQPQSKLFF